MANATIFSKTEITKVLELIGREYKNVYTIPSTRNTSLMQLYSKMAVMSLSGWLEDGMNGMVDMALKGLSLDGRKRLLKTTSRVNGCSYWHFTQRLEAAFGSHGLKFIEMKVGSVDVAILESILSNIKNLRNDISHSSVIVIKRNPADTLGDALKIIPILKNFEKNARIYRSKHF